MNVRIRLGRGVPMQHRKGKNRHVALALAGVFAPASVMAFILALWRIAADMSATTKFAITEGPFSHWHVWVVIAVVLAVTAVRLNRYGRGEESQG